MDKVNNENEFYQTIDSDFFNILKMVLYSSIGIIIFFIPINLDGQTNTLLFHMAYKIQNEARLFIQACIVIYITLGCIKELIRNYGRSLGIKKILIYSRLLSVLIIISIFYGKNNNIFLDQNILLLAEEIILNLATILPLSAIFMPFILEYGLIDIVESYCHKFTKKMFNISGKSILNILFYLFTDCFCGFFMTEKLYKNGKLRQNEACSLILNFSLASFSMIIYISEELNLKKLNLIIISFFILIITNTILARVYPLNKKKKTYYTKTTYKETYHKNNKFRKAVQKHLENKSNQNIFKHITNNLEEIMYKIMYLIPNIVLILFIGNIVINNELIIDIFNQLLTPIYELLKINNESVLNTFIINVFYNNIIAIDSVYTNIDEATKLLIGIIAILNCTSISTNMLYMISSEIKISKKEFIISYIQRIFIIMIVFFVLYYFYIGYIK